MGQSSNSATGLAGRKLPSQQTSKVLPAVSAPDIASALPFSDAQQAQNKLAISNLDPTNLASIRMAGEAFGANKNVSTNKYTQQGASYKAPTDSTLTADSQPSTTPTPPPPAPAPPAPAPPPPAFWDSSNKTPTDQYVPNLEVFNPGGENQMYRYTGDDGSPVYNDPSVDPNTGRRYRINYDNQSG